LVSAERLLRDRGCDQLTARASAVQCFTDGVIDHQQSSAQRISSFVMRPTPCVDSTIFSPNLYVGSGDQSGQGRRRRVQLPHLPQPRM
jgi:hypothetical protein